MSFGLAGNGNAFDEILSDLRKLVSSLEIDPTKVNRTQTTNQNRGDLFDDIIKKNCVVTKQQTYNQLSIDTSPGARSELLNGEFKSRSQNDKVDSIRSSHTTFVNGDDSHEVTLNQNPHELTVTMSPANKSRHYQNEYIVTNDVETAVEKHYEDNSEYVTATASCKPSTSKQEPPETDFLPRGEICFPYQQDCSSNTDSVYKNDGQTSIDNPKKASHNEPTTVCQDITSIHRSSPVVGRKAGSVSYSQDHFTQQNKSCTLPVDRKATFHLGEQYRPCSTDQKYTPKILSLKRVFSRKLSPFRRRSKLKPSKSLPETSQESQVKGDKLSHSLRLKKSSHWREKELLTKSESQVKPTRPASLQLRHQHSVSIESSAMSIENTEIRNHKVLGSHPVVNNKKRKNGRFFMKSQRNRSEPISVDSQDSDMSYTSGFSERTTDDSDATKESRIISNETIVMRDKKATHSARGSSENDRRNGSPIIRRSTIGAAYSRETSGASSPVIYHPANSLGDEDAKRSISEKHTNRHSLHVLKDQAVLSVSNNQKRWSNTEDKMVKSYTISAQLMTLENEKNYKTGNFKSRSIFQKSIKAGSKSANMSFAERKKLSERTWNNMDPFIWGNVNGQRVEISEVDLLSLSESECVALQKVAEQRLREIDLGVSINVPKDESKLHGKNSTSMLRRAGVHLPLGNTRNKSKKVQDHVFSIPLVRVVENDQLLRLQTAWNEENDNDSSGKSSSDSSPKASRRMSSSLDSYADHSSSGSMPPSMFESTEVKGSSPVTTPTESPSTRRRLPGSRKTLARRCAVGLNTDTEIDDVQSKLLESLTETSTKDKKRSLLPPTMPQVPYAVQKCCAHILKHGLDVTGIFRIGGSKKRVKQLRQEFDHGVDVKIDEDYHAHDVAALLKEFFRDLPEALLTRELYPAFISTAKLSGQRRLDALRCLVWLLPMPNRDTLQQLLSFLATVAEYSEDRTDATGKKVTGNKMNVANLSVIFGPNILHRHKNNQSSGDAQFQVQSLERAEESTYVIKIVDDMIRSQKDLFMIPRETHDEILRTLQDSDPDAVDFLLRRKAANYAKSPSSKFPLDKLDSPLDAIKNFPAKSSEAQPVGSDLNNNNKNGNNGGNEQQSSQVICSKNERSGHSYSHAKMEQRSSSEGSFSKKRSALYKNSLSFTEQDMNDILNGDRNATSREKHDNVSASEQRTPTDAIQQKLAAFDTDEKLNTLPPNTPSDQLKSVFPRQQHLNLGVVKSTNEEVFAPSTVAKQNKKTYRTKSPSPVTLRSTSATSGFEDMSSTSSESLSSNRSPTPKQQKKLKIQHAAERSSGVCSDSESSSRTRQITQSSISEAPHVPLHSLRIRRNPQASKSVSDNVVELSDLVPRTFRKGRRISKDDLYLTQDMRRRLERQRSIII